MNTRQQYCIDMGRRLNALLGRSSKASKLEKVANLAVSRISILTKLHRVRCSQARSDVIQLLRQGYQQRALVRVEQVMEEENALEALVMIEKYCHELGERSELMMQSREWECECPSELKEMASTLIFAASRTGEFPELHEIRRVLTSKYGKDFASSAVELRNGSAVYPKLVQRLSRERASLESRRNLVTRIATDNGIALRVDLQMHEEGEKHEIREQLSEPVKPGKAHRDMAISEARASVELSRNQQSDDGGSISDTDTRTIDSEEGESFGFGFEEVTRNRNTYHVEN